MERSRQIDQIRLSCKLDDEDIILYQAASRAHSVGLEGKMKSVPDEIKEKIKRFYNLLRQNGIYSGEPKDGKPTYQESVSYEEAWKRILKSNPNEYPRFNIQDTKKSITESYVHIREVLKIVPGLKKANG